CSPTSPEIRARRSVSRSRRKTSRRSAATANRRGTFFDHARAGPASGPPVLFGLGCQSIRARITGEDVPGARNYAQPDGAAHGGRIIRVANGEQLLVKHQIHDVTTAAETDGDHIPGRHALSQSHRFRAYDDL